LTTLNAHKVAASVSRKRLLLLQTIRLRRCLKMKVKKKSRKY